jgi:surfactin family lipopeptide synthetase C
LGKEQIGVEDNFFELGGHSLIATRLLSRLHESFQVDLPLQSIFESATISELAAAIMERKGAEIGEEALAKLVEDLEHLSDEEVKAILNAELL